MTAQKIKILLADDDDDDRELFQEALNTLNQDCELVMVSNGEKVVNFFNSPHEVPDFVFLDINMPKKNGIECLRFIKDIYPGNNLHVIMLSTTSAPTTVDLSYHYGASIYIQKPSRFDDLVKYLHYCFNGLKNEPGQYGFILNTQHL